MEESADAQVLTSGNELVPVQSDIQSGEFITGIKLPAIIISAGDNAITRFVEYFTVHIRNPHTRRAYFRNAIDFLLWCQDDKAPTKLLRRPPQPCRDLKAITPVLVATYIEALQEIYAKPSVKQRLAAIRMLGDWLVTGQVIASNPAHAVRGPKHIVSKGKTPVLTAEEARTLLDSIPVTGVIGQNEGGSDVLAPSLIGLRDRALIAAMLFTFGRVGAVVAMTVEDYYAQGKRSWLRLHEKGGKEHEMPAHHTLEEYIDAYIQAAGIAGDKKGPLFRTAPGTTANLTCRHLGTADVYRMIRRRITQAGIRTKAGCHSFRATGITCYLENKGTLEKAQQMASHASPRTTKLYDRTNDQITLDEVEKILI